MLPPPVTALFLVIMGGKASQPALPGGITGPQQRVPPPDMKGEMYCPPSLLRPTADRRGETIRLGILGLRGTICLGQLGIEGDHPPGHPQTEVGFIQTEEGFRVELGFRMEMGFRMKMWFGVELELG